MLFFFCLFASALAYTDLQYENSFATFMKEHDKHYADEEIIHRFNVFRRTMDIIAEHNSGNHSWTMAITQFADLTNQEFRTMMLGYMPQQDRNNSKASSDFTTAHTTDIDWRAKGAVTPIKNQGQCGSCWAFSTTGSVEGAYEIAHGSLKSFSEQALVDCSKENSGCKGGLMDYAFKYIESSGLPLETAYPYTARDGTCRAYSSVVKVTGYEDVPHKSVSALGAALVGQPIAVAVDATKWSHYGGGVYSCSGTIQLDHGVLLVGSTANTWIVKNSWGTTWGEEGYIELSNKIGADCGITQAASYPSV